MKWEQLAKLGRELPEVEGGIWYRAEGDKLPAKRSR
jgi:hypothetical protein